jgi:hypothetical protein
MGRDRPFFFFFSARLLTARLGAFSLGMLRGGMGGLRGDKVSDARVIERRDRRRRDVVMIEGEWKREETRSGRVGWW